MHPLFALACNKETQVEGILYATYIFPVEICDADKGKKRIMMSSLLSVPHCSIMLKTGMVLYN